MFLYNKSELTTKVVKCIQIENGNYASVIEDTIFYLEGGGQPSDRGFINNNELIDLYTFNDELYHVTKKELKGEVKLALDKELRYKHSLYHSAQHLVSAVFDKYESYTSSFGIKEDCFTIDLSKPHSKQELNKIETEINQLILDRIPIYTRSYDEEKDNDLTKIPSDVEKSKIRLVCIGEIDRNACGGTHLENTSDIKFIKIIKTKPSRGGVRIWVKCGVEVLTYIQDVYDNYVNITQIVGVPHEEVVETISERLKAYSKCKKTLKKLSKQYNIEIK